MSNETVEQVGAAGEVFGSEYARLESAKKELFEALVARTDLSRQEKEFLVQRIFEHSTEDGWDLADKLVLDRSARIEALIRPEFVHKHREFSLRLSNRLVDYNLYVAPSNQAEYKIFSRTLSERVVESKRGTLSEEPKMPALSAESKDLLERIDQYYAHFVRFKNLTTGTESESTLTPGQKVGEAALALDEKGLEPHYYTGPIRGLLAGVDSPLLKNDLITRTDLETLSANNGVSLNDEKVAKMLETSRFRPLDIIHDTYHRDAEKLLTQELEGSIRARGYTDKQFKLVFDEGAQQYKVLNKLPEEVEFKKKNLRVVQEAPEKILMRPGDPYYDAMFRGMNSDERGEGDKGVFSVFPENIIIDGKLYRNVSNRSHDGFIVYPDGHRSKTFFVIQNLNMTSKGLAFTTNDHDRKDGTNNFQIILNEKRLSEDDQWDKNSDTIIEADDGSIYHVAHYFDYKSQVGRNAIFKGDQMLTSVAFGQRIERLCFIQGVLTYVIEGDESSTLIHGEKTFGPYKKIILDTDNPEHINFVAEGQNNDKLIYRDGVEHRFSSENGVKNAVFIGDKVHLLMFRITQKSTQGRFYDEKVYYVGDENGTKLTEEFSGIYDFSEMGGKLVYRTTNSHNDDEAQKFIHFGDESKDVTEEKAKNMSPKPIGVINGDLFYTSGAHGISSFHSGKIDFGIKFDNTQYRTTNARIEHDKLHVIVNEGGTLKLLEYSPTFSLTKDEIRMMELLSVLKSQSVQKIRTYFKQYYPEEVNKGLLDRMRETYERSKQFAARVSSSLKETPAVFLDSIAAKKDDTSDRSIDVIIRALFPEVTTYFERAKREAGYERNSTWAHAAFFGGGGQTYEFADGDPRAPDGPELLKLREPMGGFLSTGIYGRYNQERNSWEQVGYPISWEHIGPTRELTAEVPVVEYMEQAILPKGLNAVVLSERVKGVKKDGTEIPLAATYNGLGEARVKLPKGLTRVVYSQTIQELPSIPEGVSAQEYQRFRQRYEKAYGSEITEGVAQLPEELRVFVESIQNLAPLERAAEIEEFVRSVGYYDFDNGDMQKAKSGKRITEVIGVMSQRMKELRRLNPKLAEQLEHKKYAGVCSDFAKLTTALLRESGLVSGMIKGLQGNGETSLTMKNVHAISFALFPAPHDKAQCLELDGTPSGVTDEEEQLLAAIRQKSLKERIAEFNKEKSKIDASADTLLSELEDLISHLDEEGIKRLRNGQLERTLNTILRQVKQSHVAVIERVLNASRYAGFDVEQVIEKGNIDVQIALRKFFEGEIRDEKNSIEDNALYRGERMLSTIEEFTHRYQKDTGSNDKKRALDILQKVIDISKTYLDPIESRSAIAVITYLRSEKMAL